MYKCYSPVLHPAVASFPIDVAPGYRHPAGHVVVFVRPVRLPVGENVAYRYAGRAVAVVTHHVVVAELVFGAQRLHLRLAALRHHGVDAHFESLHGLASHGQPAAQHRGA